MRMIVLLILSFLVGCAKPNFVSIPTFALPTLLPLSTSTPVNHPSLVSTLMANTDPNEFVDGKGVHMRLVPAGEFTMGDQTGDAGERPVYQGALDAYIIDKFEVTNALYKTCAEAGACQPPHSFRSVTRDSYYANPQFDNYPVVNVDWYMAKTFCEWRGAYLPTEAEWEKAARGNNDGNTYPWNKSDCLFMHDETAKEGCAGGGDTAEVGQYEKNKSSYGVYDMPGNVWEWVSSLYKPYPYNPNDGREDPNSPDARVVRSGWRSWGLPDTSTDMIGFRCARFP
jgi:formylglycine-generating enzyme required for sulfatase activity